MYGIYANIGGMLMVNVTIYIAYMDPMGFVIIIYCYDHCYYYYYILLLLHIVTMMISIIGRIVNKVPFLGGGQLLLDQ